MAEKLADLHLAELHERASELGIPRYRSMRRSELVREIAALSPEDERSATKEGGEREREQLEPAETEDASGLLEIMPQRFAFLRVRGLESSPEDVYVSASQVRRCELRSGDEVSGPARDPRRGERHRALVHVDRVNGAELRLDRPSFDDLTPILPRRRVALDRDPADVLTRAVDLVTPVALGQRVLVRAAPRSGRTTLLRGLASAIIAAGDIEVIVLLVDERPEEATVWRELPWAEVAAATADLAPADQVRVAELALERARRRAEAGADVVLIADSLSRLAVAAGDGADVKRLFGSGRDLAEDDAGSLTVIATVLEGAEDDGDGERAVITTESSLITLDPGLASDGVVPALDLAGCMVSNEDELRPADELSAARRLRSLLADLDPVEAAALLRARIEATQTNAELLSTA
jgi:transcription termination factor Rho